MPDVILSETIPWVLLVVVVLGGVGVGLFVAYQRRMQRSQAAFRQHIDAITNADDDTADGERSTLLMRGVEPSPGKADGFVVWVRGYEPLDMQRMIPANSFEHYVNLPDSAYERLQVWHDQPLERMAGKVQETFAQQLDALQAAGWQVKLDLPFSDVDRLVYLARE
jgi:hypothetical protein